MHKTRKKSLLTWEQDWVKAKDRFWSKVTKTDTCWLWIGTLQSKGYGHFLMGGRRQRAHRVVYRWAYGPIPEELLVEHKCRVRNCVRPEHLRLATNKQNMENLGLNRRSTSGVRNVVWVEANSKWKGVISHDGVRIYLGLFKDIKEAEAAVVAKRLELHTYNVDDRLDTAA